MDYKDLIVTTYTILSLITIILHVQEKVCSWQINTGRKILGLYIYSALKNLYIKFWLDFLLIVHGLYGWYCWQGQKKKKKLQVTRLSWSEFGILSVIGLTAGLLVGAFFEKYSKESHKPYFDGFHAAFVLITYGLLAHKKREAWVFWTVANIVYVMLFWQDALDKLYRQDWLKNVQLLCKYVGYLFLGPHGLRKWHQAMKKNEKKGITVPQR